MNSFVSTVAKWNIKNVTVPLENTAEVYFVNNAVNRDYIILTVPLAKIGVFFVGTRGNRNTPVPIEIGLHL